MLNTQDQTYQLYPYLSKWFLKIKGTRYFKEQFVSVKSEVEIFPYIFLHTCIALPIINIPSKVVHLLQLNK